MYIIYYGYWIKLCIKWIYMWNEHNLKRKQMIRIAEFMSSSHWINYLNMTASVGKKHR